MKKVISLILVVLMMASLVGCNSAGGGKKKVLNVSVFNGGYSIEWAYALEKEYEKIDKDTDVKIKPIPKIDSQIGQLMAGTKTDDMFMFHRTFREHIPLGRLASIKDVYESSAYNETQTIKDKLLNAVNGKDIYSYNGDYYQMPYLSACMGIIYNVTTIDYLRKNFPDKFNKFYKNDEFVYPKTSTQLIELSDEVKSTKKAYPCMIVEGGQYGANMAENTWKQLAGVDEYNHYFAGEYYDEASKSWKLDTVGDKVLYSKSKLEGFKYMNKFVNLSNGYNHPHAKSMDYMEGQRAFTGNGYASDNTPSAFMICGDWLENEMKDDLATNPQDIRFARLPVHSEITHNGKVTTVTSEEQLLEVIAHLENPTQVAKPDYASMADVNFIKDAFTLADANTFNMQMAIPKQSQNIAGAKSFMKFIACDRAASVMAKSTNGLAKSPFGYDISKDSSITLSTFQQSIVKATLGTHYTTVSMAPMSLLGGLSSYDMNLTIKMFDSNDTQTLFNTAELFYKERWARMLKDAGLAS